MKTGGKYVNYFQRRTRSVDKLLKKPPGMFTHHDFHELRVEIKKIRALLKFTGSVVKDFKWEPLFEQYKYLFRKAGKIREIHLEETVFKKYFGRDTLKNYRNCLGKIRLEEQKMFFRAISPGLKKNLKTSAGKILFSLEKVNKKEAFNYLEKKKKKIKRIMAKKSIKADRIHELRKRLKVFYYISKITRKKRLKKSFKRIESFQDLLGQWNDKNVMMSHFKSGIGCLLSKNRELAQLKKIKTKILEERKKLFKKINTEIHGEFKFDF